MRSSHLENCFPNLTKDNYRITSQSDPNYNCIAWAAGDDQHWYEPSGFGGHYWPAAVPMEYTLDSYCQVFISNGYMPCTDDKPEPGYEKVAIYVDANGLPSHAARSISAGTWTSKLGRLEDIEHDTLSALENSDYGTVARIFKKPL